MAFNPRRLVPIVVIAAFAVGGYFVEQSRAAKRSGLSGVFEAQPSSLSPRLTGRVAKLLVKEGDTVKAGQPLLELETEPVAADATSSKALAEQANEQAKLVAAGPRVEEIRRQEGVVAEARATLERLRHGARPEEVSLSREQVARAQARYDLVVNGSRKEDLAAGLAALNGAKAQLAQAERGLTSEERGQIRARAVAARATAEQARRDADRMAKLAQEGAVSRADAEAAETKAQTTAQQAHDAEEAWRRAQLGTPAEELEQARQAVRQAQAKYDLLKNGSRPEDVRQAASDLASAKASLQLTLAGTRKEDIDAGAARLSQAEALLAELKNGARPQEVAAAEAAAKAALARSKGSDATLADRIVRAPVDGTVERLLVAVGDLVPAGTPAIRFSDPTDIWIRVYVPESDLAKITNGTPATLAVDGIDGLVEGVVESVSTRGEFTPANLQTTEERGKQVFGVRIRLKNKDTRVKAGMAATVRKFNTP
ncbi:MAG: HlyD family efflux transporter periplasmic adaptor subunit [Armatimonadetes bacterium]|nr:HlyD family efflux transporter periplasmic adaptor subunit [Armatimonadota bacterium]